MQLTSSPLSVARQKLQALDVPMSLRTSYYLRVSCSQLDSGSIRYSSLIALLCKHNPAWIETCVVTPMGTLRSSHRQIDELLKPIADLHQSKQLTELNFLAAA